MRLRHLHLPSIHPHYVPYSLASRVQEHLRRQHLDFKDGSSTTTTLKPPPPTLLSFTPAPIYTLGRRQTTPLSAPETARLTAPLSIPSPKLGGQGGEDADADADAVVSLRPQIHHAPRGGLTTYHGPGQIVLWPVLDLHPPDHHYRHLSVKCYARLLETTTINTLASLFAIAAQTTEDPGVWVCRRRRRHSSSSSSSFREEGEEEGEGGEMAKIAALGVHLRRHVTALGTAVNVAMPGPEVLDEGWNPWARIVACGLAGRGVTSVVGELGGISSEVLDGMLLKQTQTQTLGPTVGSSNSSRERAVAGAWGEELARGLGLAGGLVETVDGEEVVRLMEGLALLPGENGEEEERVYVERIREAVCRR
ncbi:putative octanoyltransferase [Chaetomidium leptoderma]|uniref:Octanoyltransferase n=1 Tax=Chaetomidium leptoderma TaxID=669021 RepID=A0AAN7A0C3_9PEZI|nr:putative octanoyltransferase [Chaetomidium leptoderma]